MMTFEPRAWCWALGFVGAANQEASFPDAPSSGGAVTYEP
jgi:hypothetical protein